MSESDKYFKCGGCGRFVAWENMEKHYTTGHKEGIAVESPPAPATVANPPPQPTFEGKTMPPMFRQKELGLGFDILYMKREHPKAFWTWTGIVAALTAMAVSTLFLDIIIFKI